MNCVNPAGYAMCALLFILSNAGCVSTTLETPPDHPANPRAQSAALTPSRVLQKEFDPSASEGARTGSQTRTPHEQHGSEARERYSCPMHPQIVRNEPGKCPICGMNLVKTPETTKEQAPAPAHQHAPGQ